jgi:hypothetical protein
MVAFFAQNEQNMNSVERLVTYAELPAEGAATTPEDPPSSWPDRGEIAFKNVEMSYREGLPLVLKGVSFNMRPGEKVGKILTRALSVADHISSPRLASLGELELVRITAHITGHFLTRCMCCRKELPSTSALPVSTFCGGCPRS